MTLPALLVSEQALESSICKDDFFSFVQTFWDTVIPEEPVWNWHIEYLCQELQQMAERVFDNKPKTYDLIINIPPGSTKSTICSVMFPAWVWTRQTSCRTICGSHTAPLALDLSRKTRLIVQSEKYVELFPEVVLSEDQQTKSYFATKSGGGRMATMVGSKVTGFHAHFLIIDDPIDPRGAATDAADLKIANEWMRETLPTRKVDKAVSVTILIMQRLHQDDPSGAWLNRAKPDTVRHICLPSELSDLVHPPELKEHYSEGGLLDPVRLSRDILDQAQNDLGPYGYAGQFEQSPIPRQGGQFKTQHIQMELAQPKRFIERVRYWDKAGTKDAGAYTAGVLMGKDRHGFFWILDVKRGQWDAFEREQIIKHTAELDGAAVRVYIEQEPGSGGKESAQSTIRNLSGFRVYADRPVGAKEIRSEPFAVQVNGGNVKMLKAPWNADYISEMMYWPSSKYKDQVDASSGAFNHLNVPKRIVGGLRQRRK